MRKIRCIGIGVNITRLDTWSLGACLVVALKDRQAWLELSILRYRISAGRQSLVRWVEDRRRPCPGNECPDYVKTPWFGECLYLNGNGTCNKGQEDSNE